MTTQTRTGPESAGPRRRRGPIRWALGLGSPAVLVVGPAAIWNWNWFIPLAQEESQPSAPAQAGQGRGLPFDATGTGDAAVRDLNQEALDRISKQRR